MSRSQQTSADPVPVVIVGAGPVGVTAATLLGQYGVDCLVLDRWDGVYPLPRAVHLDDEVYRIETNLYDVTSGKLAWSGITETTLMSGDSPDIEIRPQIAALLYDMEKHKVVPKRSK